jgi:phage-related protein
MPAKGKKDAKVAGTKEAKGKAGKPKEGKEKVKKEKPAVKKVPKNDEKKTIQHWTLLAATSSLGSQTFEKIVSYVKKHSPGSEDVEGKVKKALRRLEKKGAIESQFQGTTSGKAACGIGENEFLVPDTDEGRKEVLLSLLGKALA